MQSTDAGRWSSSKSIQRTSPPGAILPTKPVCGGPMGNSGGSLADCEYPRRKRRSRWSAYFPASTFTFACIAVSGSSIRIASEAAVRQRGRHSPGAVARGLRRLENNALANCVRQSLRPPGPIRCIHLGTVPMKGPQRAAEHARVTSCSEPHAAHEQTPGLPGFAGPCEMVTVCLMEAVSWTRNGAENSLPKQDAFESRYLGSAIQFGGDG